MKTKKLRAKVAYVADTEQVVINVGELAGVQAGDQLHILQKTHIPDPDNPNETLGTVFIRKGTMVVEEIQEQLSTARVLKTRKSFMSPSEPTFTIVDQEFQQGLTRVWIEAGTLVDVLISDQSDGSSPQIS